MTDPALLVMHAMRLKGFAEAAVIAEATGLEEPAIASVLDAMAADGVATRREGRISGWVLTPDGRTEHARRLAEDAAQADPGTCLEDAYKRFLDANDAFKALCTDWQLRTVHGQQIVNDHTDAAYDAAIAERLVALHAEIEPELAELGETVARFRYYAPRLTAALARFRSGDPSALARPLSASYHDVWMELHEDLLLSLGRERSTADGH